MNDKFYLLLIFVVVCVLGGLFAFLKDKVNSWDP